MFLSILYWDDVTPHTHRHGLITPASSSVYIWSPNWRVNRSKSLVSVCPGGSITVYGSASTGSTVPGISSFMLGGVRGGGGGEWRRRRALWDFIWCFPFKQPNPVFINIRQRHRDADAETQTSAADKSSQRQQALNTNMENSLSLHFN